MYLRENSSCFQRKEILAGIPGAWERDLQASRLDRVD